MNLQSRQLLSEAGFDIENAMTRFLGNEELFLHCLQKFSTNSYFSQLESALQKKDCKEAFAACHTLKGICANLSLQPLYLLFSHQCDALRNGNCEKAIRLQAELRPQYEAALAAVSLSITDF